MTPYYQQKLIDMVCLSQAIQFHNSTIPYNTNNERPGSRESFLSFLSCRNSNIDGGLLDTEGSLYELCSSSFLSVSFFSNVGNISNVLET